MSTQYTKEPEVEGETAHVLRRLEGLDEDELIEYAEEKMRRLEKHIEWEERRKLWEEKVERDNNPVENAANQQTRGTSMEEKTKPATL